MKILLDTNIFYHLSDENESDVLNLLKTKISNNEVVIYISDMIYSELNAIKDDSLRNRQLRLCADIVAKTLHSDDAPLLGMTFPPYKIPFGGGADSLHTAEAKRHYGKKSALKKTKDSTIYAVIENNDIDIFVTENMKDFKNHTCKKVRLYDYNGFKNLLVPNLIS